MRKGFKMIVKVVLSLMMVVSLCACSSSKEQDGNKVYQVAIVKLMDHASLDEIANAIDEQLGDIAKENGITINTKIYSGQGDQSTLLSIGQQVIADQVDAIIPVATLAATVMTECAQETKTPVIYAAISDPESAELTGIDYVTGTSDRLNTASIIEMMKATIPNLEKVGLLYSRSEKNSEKAISEAMELLKAQNITIVDKPGTTNEEIIASTSVLISEGVQAVFTPTDNYVMACEATIGEMFKDAGILHFTGADSFVRDGAFATSGVNYTNLGKETAKLAYQAMSVGMADMKDYYLMDQGIVTVHKEICDLFNIDAATLYEPFGEVVIYQGE